MGRAPHPHNTSRAIEMTFWLPEAEATLVQVDA